MRIEDVVKNNGVYVSTTVGLSMYPMLRNRRDTIVVRPYTGRLKKYDVPLYRSNGKYILHRIVKVLPDSYVICGDNCRNKEYGITDDQIIGVLTEFYRDGRKINMHGIFYQTYVRIWTALYPVRRICNIFACIIPL
ncbi:MAG: hypothetical protein MR936_04165 [Eubacterium sp.]|nr:hypothetical protein [Eubacterium sp.]